MKVLVANLGSTSFKYRLYQMSDETCLARGAVDRIGQSLSECKVTIGDWSDTQTLPVPDHGVAVAACLQQLTDPEHGCLSHPEEVSAIGFKAVHGGRLSGVHVIDAEVLAAMEEMNAAAPAHNPPYIAAMRALGEQVQGIPLVAAFETGFHQTIPAARKRYAIPETWVEKLHLQKWGFHGASHRYIATRMAELLGRTTGRIISCHLGGSSSLCAIENGQSVATTMGMTPQTGLPQNNRVGDFDPFSLPLLMQHTGEDLTQTLHRLATECGLLGLSGKSSDIRDIEIAALAGDAQCQLALDVYVAEIRRQLGGMLVALGGAEAICFTAGIGENGTNIRHAVCQGLSELGIELSPEKNASPPVNPMGEATIHSDSSRVQIWIVPTNEEIIVARQCCEVLQRHG